MPDRQPDSLGKKVFLYLGLVVVSLALLEAGLFVLLQLVDRDDFFDHRHSVLESLSEEGLADFATGGAAAVMGWDNQGLGTKRQANCLGQKIDYSYDDNGARLHDGFDPRTTVILLSGDSFTQGDEVGPGDNYVARLSQLLGVSAANHGVDGYGPTQAFFNLREKRSLYPQAQVAVLGIMYENLFRMVNSYRPVLYSNTDGQYALKPHISGGRMVAHPGAEALRSLDAFKAHAESAFDNDFWAKPRLEFPYTVALLRALGSHHFVLRRMQKILREAGMPEYGMTLANDEIRSGLLALLQAYGTWADANSVHPVVLFIPRNDQDLESLSHFLDEYRAELHPSLVVGDVARMPGVDWQRYNLREQEEDGDVNTCHPSPYGHGQIAGYLAALIRDAELLPAPVQ